MQDSRKGNLFSLFGIETQLLNTFARLISEHYGSVKPVSRKGSFLYAYYKSLNQFSKLEALNSFGECCKIEKSIVGYLNAGYNVVRVGGPTTCLVEKVLIYEALGDRSFSTREFELGHEKFVSENQPYRAIFVYSEPDDIIARHELTNGTAKLREELHLLNSIYLQIAIKLNLAIVDDSDPAEACQSVIEIIKPNLRRDLLLDKPKPDHVSHYKKVVLARRRIESCI